MDMKDHGETQEGRCFAVNFSFAVFDTVVI
jgi:hypothetical protein